MLCCVVSAFGLLLAAGAAQGQGYPSRPITFIIQTAAGGPMNTIGRLLGDELEKRLGQPVINENKPGAGGLIGANTVKRAAPDGYTLLLAADAITTFNLFIKDAGFDPSADLAPISQLTETYYTVFTGAKAPAKTLKDFVAYGKANPGRMNYAGIGQTSSYLDSLLVLKTLGLDVVMISYQNSATALPAMLANDVHMYLTTFSVMGPHIKAGTIVPLATTAPARLPEMPDVPTLREQGYDMTGTGTWFALMAPPATPQPIIERLSAAVQGAMNEPAVLSRLRDTMGQTVVAQGPKALADRIARDTRLRAEIARNAKLEPQ
jgi:tripartite-type tricarboxylate transporter receptor subunit TctC